MARTPISVGLEVTDKKVFANALEWPGWSRSGKTREAALEALAAARERYAAVVESAGLAPPIDADFEVVEELPGNATTAFGAPDVRFEADRRPTTAADGERLARIVDAAWATLDRIAAAAPPELRKGPRGGGRDTAKIVEHVLGADGGYATVMGIKHKALDPADTAARDALRAAMLNALRGPSDGSPLAGRKWPVRYAARRVAWHALDHAWEIEDRSDSVG